MELLQERSKTNKEPEDFEEPKKSKKRTFENIN